MSLTPVTHLTLRSLILSFLIICFSVQSVIASELLHRHHLDLHHLHRRNDSVSLNDSLSLAEAQDIISAFQKAMAPANARILRNPSANIHKVLNASVLQQARQTAPPLAYESSNTSSSDYKRRFRRGLSSNQTSASNSSSLRYSVPPEVVEAARILAEASPPSTSSDDYAARVAKSKARYSPKTNATNVMPQRMKHPSGLVEYVPTNDLPLVMANGSSVPGSAGITARAGTTFWQETIPQLGESPFAPAGYQVWRNVMDYGAKGDGVTDDTAAIQLAITSGGRCGANCGSSTVYPATVYFPSGTYLISGSIVQYFNTELLGNPISVPTLLASSSFVGLGVISSDFYTGAQSEWYLNTNNFLRSIRNFIIDIRATPDLAEVCGIHWQVAQATSLENIFFYMQDPNEYPDTTQQGIYMENGSGGFLAGLYFVGGMFGAFFGNQQFTASDLTFIGCANGLQISWDWGWTMQGLVFEECGTGVIIVGGAGGEFSTGQGVGSLILTDALMLDVDIGISTSLFADNSTAFLLQNSIFYNVGSIVMDSDSHIDLLTGGSYQVNIDAWGFGQVTNATGDTGFVNGQTIPTMTRATSLVQADSSSANQDFFFTRRRPDYSEPGNSQIMDVKAYGALGDGTSDDTAALNHILDVAANISAIVYFPFGVYMISDTLQVPVGSRIIGQAWPQIMATGSAFADISNPHVAVKVGDTGSVGVIEIQCMLFTVRGATAGAVLVEWNVMESSQGSAGLWDSHFRVGGATGSDLQLEQCPTTSDSTGCIAASLMMHVTTSASIYMENVWIWAADHDMDKITQDTINVFSARGLLIESQGPSWLWGTSVEHSALYQYQLSGASNIVMGLIQTESPYYQTSPAAPAPFSSGLVFPNDPTFADCATNSPTCAMSWGVRMVDSSAVYILSTGLYTWFQDYDQTCILSGANNCQQKIFYVEQSFDIWIYNLITIGNIEMISPLDADSIIAADNRNGYASSILAWLGGANQTAGGRNFTGYQLYTLDDLENSNFPATCQTALTATIKCDNTTEPWTGPTYHGSLDNSTLESLVCDPTCGQSLASWYNGVNSTCAGYTWQSGASLSMLGGYIWYGYNETCQKDTATGEFCNDIIGNFSIQDSVTDMPTSELCSDCFLDRLKMMQESTYSLFNVFTFYQTALEYAVSACAFNVPTTLPDPLIPVEVITPFCVSGNYYTTQNGDSCDTIARAKSVSSASIFYGNALPNCSTIAAGQSLCIPLTCETYQLTSSDTCISATVSAGISDITVYNTWIDTQCDNLHVANVTLGSVLCASPMGGTWVPGAATNTSSFPGSSLTGYGTTLVDPPSGTTVAPGSLLECGGWYTYIAGDSCGNITVTYGITLSLFSIVNPAVNASSCTSSLVVGDAYCVLPLRPADNTTPTISYNSFGCWSNSDPSSAVLTGSEYTNSTAMTLELCALFCDQSDYAYFGLENSNECYCGSEIGINSIQLASSQCDLVCPGNSTEKCGGSTAVSLFGSTNEPLSFQYSDIGCYSDRATARTLADASLLGQSNNSIEACAAFCLPTYIFFGVEGGSDCWCGNSIGIYAVSLSESSCSTNCTGTIEEVCGGNSAIEVYGVQTAFNTSSNSTSTTSFVSMSTSVTGPPTSSASSPTSSTTSSHITTTASTSTTSRTSTSSLTSSTSTPTPVSLDGKCGSASTTGATCAGSTFGSCCSAKGNCGSTPAFCAVSNLCQPEFGTCTPVSTDGKCGSASTTGATCLGSTFGGCCSAKGNCGSTPAFCAVSNLCQPEFGTCTPVSTDGKCGSASTTGATCLGSTFGDCCSAKGNCGSSAAFCSVGNVCQTMFGTCYPTSTDGRCGADSTVLASCSGSTFGNCCSAKGNCGSSAAFCATGNLCQGTYGTCYPTSLDGRCGADSTVSASCSTSTFGNCCSAKGNCGTTAAFCALTNLCQPDFGTCT